MNRSLLVTLLVAFLPFTLACAEPSAFGAGDLNNPKPYGLTSSEEVLLENKKNLRKVVVKSNNQANEVDSLRERIDGLQTIIEGLSRKSQENKINLKHLDKKNFEELQSSNEYQKRLSEISQINSSKITLNAKEIEKIQLLITELSAIIDLINTTYVSKDEFNVLVNDVNKFKELVAKELKKASTPVKSKLEDMSKAEVAKKARYYYDKKYYTKSMEHYAYLIEKNYKPARAHYMIGEMKYYRRKYGEAIAYFKKSASLYSKASYMPILMLHTAVSMDKTGDKKNAKAFYDAIVSKYPNSEYAVTAKSKLSSMK